MNRRPNRADHASENRNRSIGDIIGIVGPAPAPGYGSTIAHTSLPASNCKKSKAFYVEALAPKRRLCK
jgi:hypothetical protein